MAKYAAFVASGDQGQRSASFRKRGGGRYHRLLQPSRRGTRVNSRLGSCRSRTCWRKRTTGRQKAGCDTATSEHVDRANQAGHYRAGLTEQRTLESIEKDTVRIDTEGLAIGQVNGLAIYSLGDHSFGRPSRITARVSVGQWACGQHRPRDGMSGRIHNKGFLILNGYLQGNMAGTGRCRSPRVSPSSRPTAGWTVTVRHRPSCTRCFGDFGRANQAGNRGYGIG